MLTMSVFEDMWQGVRIKVRVRWQNYCEQVSLNIRSGPIHIMRERCLPCNSIVTTREHLCELFDQMRPIAGLLELLNYPNNNVIIDAIGIDLDLVFRRW